jgi:CheY-like chemotaxis protein
MLNNKPSVLVVEDSDAKFASLEALINSTFDGAIKSERAATITDAEVKIASGHWALLLLDISMDITKSMAGPKLGGHATLGGLNIANRMFLLGLEVPTIIVTAFDMFQETKVELSGYDSLGLEDIERRAASILGSAFIGCVRYGDPGWQASLVKYLKRVIVL